MTQKEAVFNFIKEHKEVFQFQLVNYFTPRYTICADRLARFLRAEGKVASREPTEEEKIRHRLHARTIIYFVPEKEKQKQEYFNFG